MTIFGRMDASGHTLRVNPLRAEAGSGPRRVAGTHLEAS